MSNVPTPSESPFDILICGLGVLNVDHVTLETERALRSVRHVLYVDTGLATPPYLQELCPRVTPLFDQSYTDGENRLNAYHHMAATVIEAALEEPPVAFAMQGHPIVGAYAPVLIRDAAALLDLRVKVLPGISSLACLFAELMLDPCVHGLQQYEATDLLLRRRPLLPDVPAVIWQIGNLETRLHTTRRSRPERFERFRDHLLRFYPPEHEVAAVHAAAHPLMQSTVLRFPLGEIAEHAAELHVGFSLYIPPTHTRPIEDLALATLIDSAEHLRRVTED